MPSLWGTDGLRNLTAWEGARGCGLVLTLGCPVMFGWSSPIPHSAGTHCLICWYPLLELYLLQGMVTVSAEQTLSLLGSGMDPTEIWAVTPIWNSSRVYPLTHSYSASSLLPWGPQMPSSSARPSAPSCILHTHLRDIWEPLDTLWTPG